MIFHLAKSYKVNTCLSVRRYGRYVHGFGVYQWYEVFIVSRVDVTAMKGYDSLLALDWAGV
jgi:hypothetical protein